MKKYGFVLALMGLLVLVPSSAFADGSLGSTTCLVGTPIVLSNDNNADIDVDITVCVNGDVVTVAGIDWTGGPTSVQGIDKFFWDSGTTLDSATAPWTQDNCTGAGNPPCNADGFGDYYGQSNSPGDNGGVGLTWNLSGAAGTDFAVHIRFGSGCSAYVSSGRTTDETSSNGECGTTEVPEPATLTLLGTGLLGIAGAVRRRMAKKT